MPHGMSSNPMKSPLTRLERSIAFTVTIIPSSVCATSPYRNPFCKENSAKTNTEPQISLGVKGAPLYYSARWHLNEKESGGRPVHKEEDGNRSRLEQRSGKRKSISEERKVRVHKHLSQQYAN